MQPGQPKLISNEYRTSSMTIPSVAEEAMGGQHALGYRMVNGKQRATGYAVATHADDPLEILIREEELSDL